MEQTTHQERTFMDDLDRNIIQILQGNGRASNASIARDVGVSEGTVRRRLKTLVNDGIIKVVALPDPEVLGYDTEALVGIQVDPDKIDEVAGLLVELKESSWVSVTTGSFDIFCWVTLPTSEELGNFLKAVVGTIPGVRRTETFVSLSVRKRNYGIRL
ncbi:MAG: Lrp/AsnC family transcriptional regulator [SAR202 cluster bacterium]|nr:Lrp/AsnC family transcriptional regulator [SAR202 cluster bacterium]